MAVLLSVHEIAVPVTHGAFALVTGAGGDPLALEQPLASVVDGGIGFFSAASDHTATVRVEFWDLAPDGSLDDGVTGTVDLAAPAVALVGVDTGFSREIPVPFTGAAAVHVACTGRDEAARLAHEEHELFFADVEVWLVRLWPAGDDPGDEGAV